MVAGRLLHGGPKTSQANFTLNIMKSLGSRIIGAVGLSTHEKSAELLVVNEKSVIRSGALPRLPTLI